MLHARGTWAAIRRGGPIAWPDAVSIAVKMCGRWKRDTREHIAPTDIKARERLVNDYGSERTSDANIRGSRASSGGLRKQPTGLHRHHRLTPTPEVLTGNPPRRASPMGYSMATVYGCDRRDCRIPSAMRRGPVIAHTCGSARRPVPEDAARGVPVDVCAAI